MSNKKFFAVVATSMSLLLTACSSGESANTSIPAVVEESVSVESTDSSVASDSAGVTDSVALTVLDELTVKGRAPKTGYTRSSFGSSWKDVDNNGCDTRNDILQRDLDEKVLEDECVVTSGVLYPDPYTGNNIVFVKGKSQVDIDHVVALSDAWQKGAFAWEESKREAIANDPLNLLAVEARANRQKSDSDAASWLPSNKSYRCDYVARQIAVKKKYDVWVTEAEKEAMSNVLSACPDQTIPGDGELPTKPQVDSDSSSQENIESDDSSESSDSSKKDLTPQRFDNCAEAREAGVTPLVEGDGFYELNTHMDRDKDGTACEG